MRLLSLEKLSSVEVQGQLTIFLEQLFHQRPAV